MALCSPPSSVMVTAYLCRPGVSTIEVPRSHQGESSPPRWLASVPSLPAIKLPSSSSSSQGGRERILLSEQPSFRHVSIKATTRSHQRGDSFPIRRPVSSSSSAYLCRPGHSSIGAIHTRRSKSFPLRRFVSVPSSSHASICLPGRSSIEKTRTRQGESFPPRRLLSVFSSAMDPSSSSSSSSAYLCHCGHPPIEVARTHRDGFFPPRRPISVSSSAMDSPSSSQGGRERTLSEKPSFRLLRPFPELSGTPPLDSLASDPADPVHDYDDYEDDGDCGGIGLDPEIRTVLDNVAWLRKRNEEMSARMQEMERLLVDTVKFVNSKGRMIRSKDLKLEKLAMQIEMGNVMEMEKEAEKKTENGMEMGMKNETEKEKANTTENEMEKEMKNKTEKEIENKTENKIENETEKKIENKTEKETEKEIENNKTGNKTEKETENKIESRTEKEMENKTENIRENKTENRRENKAEKETENKTENKTKNNKTEHLQQNKLPPKQAFPTITASNGTLSQRRSAPKESITNGRNTNHSLPLANNRNFISKGIESEFGKTTNSLSFNPPTREAPMGESINGKATHPETLECTMVHPGALSCTKTSIQTDPSKKFVTVSIETTVRCTGAACSLTALKEEDYIALAVQTLAQTSLQLKKTKLEMVRNRDHGGTSIPHKNIVDILAHGKIVASRPMEPPSSFGHESFIVELKDLATGKKINALFKPRLQSDDKGWHRVPMELVAYELNLMLGMDLVPPVAYRRGGFHVHFKHYEDGAFIYYVPCARPLKTIPATNWGVPVVCLLSDTRILDALLNNSDRHLGHFLFGEHWTGKKELPFLIDHAASFRKEAVVKMDHDNAFQTGPLRSVSAKTYLRLRFLEKQIVAQKFQEFLSDKEIDQLMERRDMTLEYLDKLAHDKGYSKTVVEA